MKASQRVHQWIERALPELKPGSRLPSDAELADGLGVSIATVRRVLRSLDEAGVVERIWGSGTFVPGDREEIPTAQASVADLVDHLRAAIADGSWQEGDVLPPVTTLARQLHLAPATVSRAYRQLQESRRVFRLGKSFFVGRFASVADVPARRTLLLFNESADFDYLFREDPLARSYRRFERELARHGFVIRYLPLSQLTASLRNWRRRQWRPYGLAFVDLAASSSEQVARLLADSGSRLRHAGIPILFDSIHPPAQAIPGLHVLHRGTLMTAFARQLGEFLVRRGLRNSVWFIEESDPGSWYAPPRLMGELARLDPSFRLRIVVRSSIFRRPSSLFVKHLEGPLKEELARHHHPRWIGSWLRSSLQVVPSLADGLRAGTSDDVWIFARDTDADAALRWAHNGRVAVPSQVNVIGVQDDPRHYASAITYCGPDFETTGYLMAHAILGDLPVARTGRGYLRTPAHVVERQTTG